MNNSLDAHLHLDAVFTNPMEAASALDESRQEAGISHCIVLHLISQNWSKEDF